MSSTRTSTTTLFLTFIAFVLAFGWEGPVVFYFGMEHSSITEMAIGSLFTIFFWAMFGFKMLTGFMKQLFKLKAPQEELAGPSAGKLGE